MKVLIGIFSLLTMAISAFGATYNSTTTGGNWNAGGSWVGGNAPGNWGSHTANIYGNITQNTGSIQGFSLITLNNGSSFTRTGNLTLQQVAAFNVIDGNIIINGNLTLDNSSLTITTGSLTVTGTLTLTNGATLNHNSTGSISVGSYTTSGSGGTLNLNNGNLIVSNTLTINSGSTVNIGTTASATVTTLNVNNSGATLNNSGSFTVNGNASYTGAINNNSTGSMQINGNLTSSGGGGSVYTNSGNLKVTGDMTIPSSGKLYINPGGVTDIDGSVTIGDNNNLTVGTNVAPPPYADLIVRTNLTVNGGATVNQNGRVAVLGNLSLTGGGTNFTINNGGQVYVDGNLNVANGGNHVNNNNSTSPYGLYVNGTVASPGGGSSVSANHGDENTLFNTNLPFYNWVQSVMGALPVTLLYLQCRSNENGVILNWATATEENADYFHIERSNNGINFEKVGEVAASGNSKDLIKYDFTDDQPFQGKNYYRLRTVDFDNSYEYSRIISVAYQAPKSFSVYPNPYVGSDVHFKTNFAPQENDMIVVLNTMGVEVTRIQASHKEMEIGYLNPGVYFFKYIAGNFDKTVRVIKGQ